MRISIGAFKKSLAIQQDVLWGYTLHVAWGWMMFTGSPLNEVSYDVIIIPFVDDSLYVISLGANVVTLILFSIIFRHRSSLFKKRSLVATAAILMSLGTFFATDYIMINPGGPTFIVELLAGVFTGIGHGTFLVLWGELFVSVGTKKCLIYCTTSSLIAALIWFLALLLPSLFNQALVVLFPLAEAYLYQKYTSISRLNMSKYNDNLQKNTKRPHRLLSLCLLCGFSYGFIRGFINPVDGVSFFSLHGAQTIISIILSCILVFIVAFLLKINFGKLTYQIALPLMAAGFFLLSLPSEGSSIGVAVYRIGYQYFYLVLFPLLVFFSRRGEYSGGRIFSLSLAYIQGSKLLGYVISASFTQYLGTMYQVAIISEAVLLMMLLLAVFSKESQLSDREWERARPTDRNTETFTTEQLYNSVAKTICLSPRETDVFLLLLKGRSRAYIAKELVISEETVKSHSRNIYQKAEVHSKQALIDKVEAMIPFATE